jgi:hypothetical protein
LVGALAMVRADHAVPQLCDASRLATGALTR